MTTIACPKCADSVRLPPRASQRATVRCPLCQETFPLAEVLDKMPPALIVVDDPDAAAVVPMSGSVTAEGTALATFVEPESGGGGFAPLSIETAAPGASTATAARRRRPAAPARRKPKNPVAEFVKIVLGGIAGLLIAQVILWYLGSYQVIKVNGDPFGVGPKVARFAPWIVPEKYRGQKPSGGAASQAEKGAPAVVDATGGVEPKELPSRTFVDPNKPATASDAVRTPGAKAKRPGNSQKKEIRDRKVADAPEVDAFGIGAAPKSALPDLTTVPEPETNPLEDMQLDTELPPDGKLVADPVVSPAEEMKEAPAAEPKSAARPLPNAPQMTAAELASAAEEAKTVLKAWRSAPDDEDARELIRQSYVALAKLGEALAFRDKSAGAESQTAGELVQSLTTEGAKLNTLGRVANGWLKAASRDSSGVLLVGVVKQVRQQGGYDVIELALSGSDQPVAVYRTSQPGKAHSPDSQLLVLGAIIEDPAKNLVGYEGEAAFVVWEGLSRELPGS